MKHTFFTPGPSELYPTIPNHINEALELQIPSISHRSEEFRKIFDCAAKGVRDVMGAPSDVHVFFVASGTEAMERVIQNGAESKSFHFVNGSFSSRMHKIAIQLGKDAKKNEALAGKAFDFQSITIPKDAELICVTHNETSIGVKTPMEDISRIKKNHPHALISVDVVSSAPCVDIDWDAIDCAFFSVQKCFGLPAGLGVILANKTMIQKAKMMQEKGISIGSYHGFLSMAEEEAKLQTPETPNVLGMYLLGKICGDFQNKGIRSIKKESKEKADLLYSYFDNHSSLKPFVDQNDIRSDTVIVANTPRGSKPVISALKEKGMIVGQGYAEYKDSQIRIANFPAHSMKDMKRLLDEFSKIV